MHAINVYFEIYNLNSIKIFTIILNIFNIISFVNIGKLDIKQSWLYLFYFYEANCFFLLKWNTTNIDSIVIKFKEKSYFYI